MSTTKLFPSHRPSPGPCSSKLQVQTHPLGSHEPEGKTFAWCGWGGGCSLELTISQTAKFCSFVEFMKPLVGKQKHLPIVTDSTAGVLGVPASGKSPGKVFQQLLSEWEEQPSPEQSGDPCRPGTSGFLQSGEKQAQEKMKQVRPSVQGWVSCC